MAYTLGIDLGTTFSAAAIVDDGRADIVHLGSRAATVPSVVFLREDGTLLTGEAAERRIASEPSRGAREFKRRLGDSAPIIMGGTPFGAEALIAELLKSIVAQVTEERGTAPSRVAITHPASYGPFKLDLLEQAARQAGLEDVLFLSEPLAAAYHYAQQERIPAGSVIAVYDFGGGTFDAAVLRKADSDFEVLGKAEGLERLGGIDFDEAVFAHVVETLGRDRFQGDSSTAFRAAVTRLRDDCREAKESLSEDTEATIPVLLPSLQTEVRLTRSQLEDVIRPRIRETVAALERSIRSAGLQLEDVDRILLIGGTSRIPLVGQTVRELTGRPVVRDSHPKHTIALGAALFLGSQATKVVEAVPGEIDASAIPSVAPAIEAGVGNVSVEPAPVLTATPPAPIETSAIPRQATETRSPTPSPSPPPVARPRRSIPALLVIAGLGVIVAAIALGALLLSGGSDAEARITDAELNGTTYTVWFDTDLTLSNTGNRLVFYWNTTRPESGLAWAGGSPVSFTAQKPSGATKICIAVVGADGSIRSGSGNCWAV